MSKLLSLSWMLIINWPDFCPSWALAPSPAQTQDSLDAPNLGDGKVICFQLQGVTFISGWSFSPLIYTFPYLFHLLSLCLFAVTVFSVCTPVLSRGI